IPLNNLKTVRTHMEKTVGGGIRWIGGGLAAGWMDGVLDAGHRLCYGAKII
ncbi:hypothetical protein SISNIDRAFT_460944, partial [Sistotremastrum niveocremeum HHB9708]